MKTAISASDCSFNALVDSHFARCSCFVIHDDLTGSVEFLPNPYMNITEDAGFKVVEMLHEKHVKTIIAMNFGMKIKSLLDTLQIQMIVIQDQMMTVTHIIELLTQKHKAMPKMDGTGPDGKGPGTGRGLGKCKSASTDEKSKKLGKGMGQKRKSGGGQGKGKRMQSGS
jgi:predicted Fe-Mo cluster-binding NifX family protein